MTSLPSDSPAPDDNNKVFKILCIDGGGMKGIFSSSVLERIEEVINSDVPEKDLRIVDYFDMICGTSTGGLIALALSIRKSAAEITKFYEEYGEKIFPDTLPLIKGVRVVKDGALYYNEQLRAALTDFYGEKKIGDSECLLCIPSYCLQEGKPWIFRFDHKVGKLKRDNKCSLVDAGMATAAAPFYFPKVQLSTYDNFQFLDGGIFANNPSLVGITEALRYFVGNDSDKAYKKLAVLSVASLNESASEGPELPISQGITGIVRQTTRAMMAAQSSSTDFMAGIICDSLSGKMSYVRIPSDTIGQRQEPAIQLDASSPVSINLMKGKGSQQGLVYSKKEEVLKFFKHRKTFLTQEDNG